MKKVLMLLSLCLTLLSANSLQVGSSINEVRSFKFETPQGRQMKIPKSTRLLLVAFEKDTGKLVNNYLDTQNPMYLPKRRVIFVADIHSMPSIITSMFALPKLKKYKHLIYLHYDDEFQEFIPNTDEKVTIIRLKDQKVESITYVSTQAELKAEIEK
jgi:hypothetical protein